MDNGILIYGNGSWSIDQQRYNFQFGGQTFWEIKQGKMGEMLRDVAYQSRTTDFWGACDGLGDTTTYELNGAFNDGKGEPGQINAVSAWLPLGPLSPDQRAQYRSQKGVNVMLLSEAQAKAICDKLLGCLKADDAQVSVSSEDFSNLRFAANDFTTSGRREGVSVSVTVWFDKKRGSASASSLEEQSLQEAVKQAEDLARISPVDHEYLPTLGAQTYQHTGGYVEATANVSLSDRAKAIDGIIRTCEKQGIMGAGFHEAGSRAQAFATKHGNFHYRPSSLTSLSVTARTRDGGSSGYFLRDHFDVRKLDTERIGREAIRKALDGQKPRVLDPRGLSRHPGTAGRRRSDRTFLRRA